MSLYVEDSISSNIVVGIVAVIVVVAARQPAPLAPLSAPCHHHPHRLHCHFSHPATMLNFGKLCSIRRGGKDEYRRQHNPARIDTQWCGFATDIVVALDCGPLRFLDALVGDSSIGPDSKMSNRKQIIISSEAGLRMNCVSRSHSMIEYSSAITTVQANHRRS